MLEKTGRAIIKIDGKYIFIKRTKYDKNGNIIKVYYTFPGGHLENNETYEEATIREVYEELGVNITIKDEFAHIFNHDLNREEKFYKAKYISGKLGTGNGPEFITTDYLKYGKYELIKIGIEELKNYNILPIEVKNKIISEL